MCLDAIVISTFAGGISLIISVLMYNLRRSRCTNIKCGSCIECSRSNMSIDELSMDQLTLPKI